MGKEVRVFGVGKLRQPLEKRPLFEKAPASGVGTLGFVDGLAIAPDGRSLILASQDYQTIIVWDLATGQERSRLVGPQRVFSLSLSVDGKTLATGGAGGQVDLWDLGRGRLMHQFVGHQGRAFSVAFSSDGKLLASGGDDHICLWETGSWREIRQLKGHEGGVQNLMFAADSRILASAGMDQTARLWNVATGTEIRTHQNRQGGRIGPMALSPNGKLIAAGPGGVVVWDVTGGEELYRQDGPGGSLTRLEAVYALAFSPNSRTLALASPGAVRLCEAMTGKLQRRIDMADRNPYTAVFSADGRSLLTGGTDRLLRLWELATGKERRRFAGHQIDIHSVALSPDGRLLASASGSFRDHRDDSVRLWDAATGKELRRFTGHRNVVVSVAFAPDGKTLASASEDNTVLIWDTTGLIPEQASAPPRDLEALWNDLAEDAAKAYEAIWAFTAVPQQSVSFFRRHMQPAAPVDAKRLAQLIADLDSNRFEVRQQATGELRKLGEPAEPAMRDALAGQPTPEARRRLEQLTAELAGPVTAPDALRALRAIEVLERCATPEARRLLETLATGTPAARLTREAKASLERLSQRANTP
jgi:WD40 repeat protein